ncbi:hypothetical protein V8E36_007401 [Tilletia maclaganii]
MATDEWQTVGGGPAKRSAPASQGRRALLVMCVGLVGSGKSTVASAIQAYYPDAWVRCNQDEFRNRQAVESKAHRALRQGQNVIIDRTNADSGQRSTWIDLAAEYGADVVTVIFDTPFEQCLQRLELRTNHPTLKTVQHATDILHRFARQISLPPPSSAGVARTILLNPAAYSAEPTQVEVDDILERISSQPSATKAEIDAAQRRCQPSPGFTPLRAGRYQDPYRQQRLPYRDTRPTAAAGGSHPSSSHAHHSARYHSNSSVHPNPTGRGASPAARDPARSYASASLSSVVRPPTNYPAAATLSAGAQLASRPDLEGSAQHARQTAHAHRVLSGQAEAFGSTPRVGGAPKPPDL